MNTTFLSQTANYIYTTYKDMLADICIIMPSNRGMIYLKKYLSDEIGKTFFPPDFYSIEQFMQKISGLSLISNEEIWIKLYNIYINTTNDNPINPFHEFAGKANLILQDFNEIDLALANPSNVFSDLADIKALNFFGKSENELSMFQKDYLAFFKQLLFYYEKLSNDLLKDKKAYQGLMYRKASENIETFSKETSYYKYVFIGFNAMQASEKHIIKHFKQENKLDFIIDADEWYLYDQQQEAGKFLRELMGDLHLKNPHFIDNNISRVSKKIELIGFPHKSLQAKHLSTLLQQSPTSANEKTAIVLADESLLLPVLYSIDTSQLNITMGYPLIHSLIYKLLYQYIQAIENKSKLQRPESPTRMYHKDLYAFFNNIYVQRIFKNEKIELNSFLRTFIKKAKLFYTKEETKELCKEFPAHIREFIISIFFVPDTYVIIDYLRNILQFIETGLTEHIEKEEFKLLSHHMDNLSDLLKQIPNPTIKSLRFLFESYISTLSLSFKSNPLSKIQIMGMLETRTLDFDRVIILSMNEGILPSGKNLQSFLPFDLKLHYHIPTYQNAEAIFSYHFYRLLQRAKQIYFLYDLDNKDAKMEKSRFVKQIQTEWNTLPNIQISESILGYPNPLPTPKEIIEIRNNQSSIDSLAQKSFSPTSINKFLRCKLQFYLSEILQLDKQEEISEEIQANVIGSVIHKILETLLKDKSLDLANIDEEFIGRMVQNTFCDPHVSGMDLKPHDILYENNYLVFHITVKYIKEYIRFYLKQKKELLNWAVFGFEQSLKNKILLTFEDTTINVSLNGISDRIDSHDGITCIVDYKTGKVEEKELKVSTIEELFDGNHDKAFQLMFYAYLYYSVNHKTPLQAQIISFRNLHQTLFLHINENKLLTDEMFVVFESLLKQHLSLLFDITHMFTQTTAVENCKWCDYQSLCMRE